MTVEAFVDSSEVAYYLDLSKDGSIVCAISSTRITLQEIQTFKFGSLELTDDDAYLGENARFQNFGEIRMVFTKVTGATKSSIRGSSLYGIPETTKIHEKSKKGLTHHIKLATKIRADSENIYCYNCTPCGILGTFVFKYRPLEILQAHGIVMRELDVSTSSQGSDGPGSTKRKEMDEEEEESDKEDSADEEEKALLAQLEKVRQKKLAKDAEARARKKIKLEPKAHFLPGEIIDLTDDTPARKSWRLRRVPKTPAPVVDLT